MNNCILAMPHGTGVYAEAGPYKGDLSIDNVINDNEFVEWEGRAARHFVPVDYYKQFMPEDGTALFEETYDEFSHFVFLENNDSTKKIMSVMLNEETYIIGQWVCFLWKEELRGFPEDRHAQSFFYWLTSDKVQGLIYDKHKTEGTEVRFCPATRLI